MHAPTESGVRSTQHRSRSGQVALAWVACAGLGLAQGEPPSGAPPDTSPPDPGQGSSPRPGGDNPRFAVLGGRMIFSGADAHGFELWVTGGEINTSKLLKDIDPEGSSGPKDFVTVGDSVYFSAERPGEGRELWRTDGTTEGTELVGDLLPGEKSSFPSQGVALGERLVFVANDGEHGRELWSLVEGKPQQILDLREGPKGSNPQELVALGGVAYFTANDGKHGVEVWRTDGTAEGTVLVDDLAPGSEGSEPYDLAPVGAGLVFAADDLTHGHEPWYLEVGSESPRMVGDLVKGEVGSNPTGMTAVGGNVFFSADDGVHGHELWSMGVRGGEPRLVMDLWGGEDSGEPHDFVAWGDDLVFVATNADWGEELWVLRHGSNHPYPNEVVRGPQGSNPGPPCVWNEGLYFAADDGTSGIELYCDQGGGPYRLRDLVPGAKSSNPNSFVPLGDQLLFIADHRNPIYKSVLFRTDGRPNWTHRLASIRL